MKSYFTFFIILCYLQINSQSVYNAELIKKLNDETFTESINVLLLTKPHSELNTKNLKQVKLKYKVGNVYALTANRESIIELAKLKNIVRIEYTEHHLQLMSDTSVIKNRIKNIKLGTPPLTKAYDGNGVIVGIIDSGTDFNHPDFKDENGKSRINYLWDMTKPIAINTPTAFGYGQEWNNTQIDLGQCTHTDLAHYGHGTNSTGIAAGNGYAINKYEGMAPKADLIVVALDFNRNGYTIADAVQYIVTKADQLNKPLVINASVGDYYGSHDGTDLETQLINNLIANTPGRALVASSGNAGSAKYHVGYFTNNTDTSFTWIKNSSSIIFFAEYADTNNIKNVKYSIGVTNNALHDLGRTSFKSYTYALNTFKRDTIYNNSHRIGIIESMSSINSFGVFELLFNIRADSLNYLWNISHTGEGRIDSWNFDYVTANLPTSSRYPKIINYKPADTLQTIVSGFQCSNEVITVGNYINRNQYVDINNVVQVNNEVPGQLHSSSSGGPTRDGKVKPDIVATGALILASSPLQHIYNLKTNAPYVIDQGGFHVTAGGTSASSPVVAGFAALYFQKHPTATNQQLKNAIINCAYNDEFTTANLPSTNWGNGKLDGFASMTCGEVFNNVRVREYPDGIQIFPNPLSEQTTLYFNDNELKKLKLYNSSGQLIKSEECDSNKYILYKNNLTPGLYILISEEKNTTYKIKIIVL